MILVVLFLACVVALSGGFIVGFVSGNAFARNRPIDHSPDPFEILSELSGPLGLGRR